MVARFTNKTIGFILMAQQHLRFSIEIEVKRLFHREDNSSYQDLSLQFEKLIGLKGS